MKIICNRLYKENIDIRDHIVDMAIKNNVAIIVKLLESDEEMHLTPKQLKEDVESISKPFKSKYGKKEYRLHSYKWKPI